MAGTALLPWEEWLVRPIYVALRRMIFKRQRQKDLSRSKNWNEGEGVIHRIESDSSLPREGVRYVYECKEGYYSGLHWRWFEVDKPRVVKGGDRILLRYNPDNPEESVFVDFQDANSPVFSVPSIPEL